MKSISLKNVAAAMAANNYMCGYVQDIQAAVYSAR